MISSDNYLEISGGGNDRTFESMFKQLMSTEKWTKSVTQEDIEDSKVEAFCVKTKDINTKQKLFVNFCHSSAMKAPTLDLNEAELRALLASEEATSFTIPMLLTQLKSTLDKSGSKALVIDVIINTEFYVNKVVLSELYKTFLITVSLETIENSDKYKGFVDKNGWVLLKNKKYQEISDNYCNISDKSDDKIVNDLNVLLNINGINNDSNDSKDGFDCDYIETNVNNNKLIESVDSVGGYGPKPEWKPRLSGEGVVSAGSILGQSTVLTPRFKLKYDVANNCVAGQVTMPAISDSKQIELLIGEDRIVLSANDYKLDIFVPLIISAEQVSADFDGFTHILNIKMPLI